MEASLVLIEIAAIIVLGLGLGAWFRVPALLVATALLLAGIGGHGVVSGWTTGKLLLAMALAAFLLHAAYLAGLYLFGSRSAPRRPGEP
jgi:hypothetical protein